MSRDDHKILILCADSQTLNVIAKAIYFMFPAWSLSFTSKAEECIAKCDQRHPNIVIAIPNESVCDVRKLIQRLKDTIEPPKIILASRYSSGKIISDYLAEGVTDIISAPVNIDLLITRLAAIVDAHHRDQT